MTNASLLHSSNLGFIDNIVAGVPSHTVTIKKNVSSYSAWNLQGAHIFACQAYTPLKNSFCPHCEFCGAYGILP